MKYLLVFTFLLAIFSNLKMIISDIECPNISSFGDRRKSKDTLRLVQYNVEWLFIDYYSPMDCPGNGCTWKSVSDAETHMNYIADTIRALNPDIINLCEVEGCDELNILTQLLTTSNDYNVYLKKGTDTGTGQNVGLITKIDPITNLYRISNSRFNLWLYWNTFIYNSVKTLYNGV
jgi:hypothetical protein